MVDGVGRRLLCRLTRGAILDCKLRLGGDEEQLPDFDATTL